MNERKPIQFPPDVKRVPFLFATSGESTWLVEHTKKSGLHSSTKPTRLCMNLNQTPPPVQGVSRTTLTLSTLFPLSAVPNPGNTHSANAASSFKPRDPNPLSTRLRQYRGSEPWRTWINLCIASLFPSSAFSLSPFPSLSPFHSGSPYPFLRIALPPKRWKHVVVRTG